MKGTDVGLFYRPSDGWAGDFIPFFWDGRFHLFYLKDYCDRAAHGEGTPWFHIASGDMVNFAELGEAIPRGGANEQDQSVFTGCVFEDRGRFHIFYTGHNAAFRNEGKPQEAVMHATSADLICWEKDSALRLCADTKRYELHDWRDPFVFWNESARQYWMLLAARLTEGPEDRRGCTALCVSHDLRHWEVRDPFWAPGLYYTHECPDLFRMGEWWYLIFSTFSGGTFATRYVMSRTLGGPWVAPKSGTLDGRHYYAAKTASDGRGRYAFGWVARLADEKDSGEWRWGGNLAIHELVQQPDGALSVRMPEPVWTAFGQPVALAPAVVPPWRRDGSSLSCEADGFSYCHLSPMPAQCLVEAEVAWSPGTAACGLILRADGAAERFYEVALEPAEGRVRFARVPPLEHPSFQIERVVDLSAGKATVVVVAEDSIFLVYVNGSVALSARGYDFANGAVAVFLRGGRATFKAVRVRTTSLAR